MKDFILMILYRIFYNKNSCLIIIDIVIVNSQQIGVKQGRAMEKLKLAHAKQVEEFSTDVQKVLNETRPQTDTITSIETVL